MRPSHKGPDWKTIAVTYDEACVIASLKNIWMVNYLRARRDGDTLKAFYRLKFFEALGGDDD